MLNNKQWLTIFIIGLIACVILIVLGVSAIYSIVLGFGISAMVGIAVVLMRGSKKD